MISLIRIAVLLSMLMGVLPVIAEQPDYEFEVSTQSIIRTSGRDELSDLVKKIYPKYPGLWEKLEQEIRKINPQAFNRYTGKIIPNQRIQLVTVKRVIEEQVIELHQIGMVVSLRGKARGIGKSGRTRYLAQGADIYEGDRIVTEKDSTVEIELVDRAVLFIKEDSAVRISQYRMAHGFDRGGSSVLDLIKGGLRTLTGLIAGDPLSRYRMNTSVATIGVRGTDYVLMYCRLNDCTQPVSRNDEDARLHLLVLDGVITIDDDSGQTGDLSLGQYAVLDGETMALIDKGEPAKGLLTPDELERFEKIRDASRDESIWPWVIGGALFGFL